MAMSFVVMTKNLYDELSIHRYHKDHVPNSEDVDTFLCHNC
jgi:hypothetical protein